MTKQEVLLVLNAIPGMGSAAITKLRNAYPNLEDIFNQTQEDFMRLGLSINLANNLLCFPRESFLENEFKLMKDHSINVFTIEDERFPSFLKPLEHAPIVLYLKGDEDILEEPSIAIVGARKASHYGISVASEFAQDFVNAQMTVVSGMALGIDTAAHQGALKLGGKTIAVLGCGLNHVYPKENKDLFNMINKKGLLVSEFPIDTPPFAYNFPRRNRIISGLSLGTVVIEAAERSGALITVDYAMAQQREIFVVPGNIDSLASKGTNRLLRDGARIVLSAKDVLEDLGIAINEELKREDKKDKIHVPLSPEEYKIYELIGTNPLHIDIISTRGNLDISVLMSEMLNLELKGVIKQLPGQYYVRV